MKIQLDFGYADYEDVLAECGRISRTSDCTYEIEDSNGPVKVLVSSQYRWELRKFVGLFLSEPAGSAIVDSVIDFNIVQ